MVPRRLPSSSFSAPPPARLQAHSMATEVGADSSVFFNRKADNYGIGKQKTKQVFPFAVLKPTPGSGFSRSVVQQRKNVLFALSTLPLPRVLASQDTGHHKSWRAYAPLSLESSLPSVRAVGGLCLEVSLGTWGPDPILYQLKNDLEMGQAPTSQARPHNPDHLRPSNLAATTLRLVDHICLLYTSPSPRDGLLSRMPSSA